MFILVVIYILLLVFLCFRKHQVRTNFKTVTEPIIMKQEPIIKQQASFVTENNSNNNLDLNNNLDQDMLNNLDNRRPVYPMHQAFIMNF